MDRVVELQAERSVQGSYPYRSERDLYDAQDEQCQHGAGRVGCQWGGGGPPRVSLQPLDRSRCEYWHGKQAIAM